MYDGAPVHFQLRVRRLLTRRYGQYWRVRSGLVSWHPRSLYLNPMDFCVWGHFKSLVYANEVYYHEELRLRIEAAFQYLQNSPALLRGFATHFKEELNVVFRRMAKILNIYFNPRTRSCRLRDPALLSNP
ncbi:hypothetical protein C0J52_26712 [Blattella germanica]|nr:hypothetical protein C0J52_26712 [Blattella germanica]